MIKSAYVIEKCKEAHLKISKQGRGEFSNQIQTAKEWKKVWSISAPPKTLIILWRFAHDCLPTGQQMKQRNNPTSYLCSHCGREENLFHTFIGCHFVVEIWKEIKNRTCLKLNQIWMGSPRNWLLDCLFSYTEREAGLLAIVFWYIWEARNVVRNGETENHPSYWVEKC
jgi:hypothetical protein